MVLATQHPRHTHCGVIDRIAEKERSRPVRSQDHEISDVVGEEALRTVHEIHELDPTAVGHLEPHTGNNALGPFLLALRGRKLAAGAGVTRRLTRGELRLARDFELERRAIAGIYGAPALQHLEVVLIDRRSPRLPIR